jgi:hypothetical protein
VEERSAFPKMEKPAGKPDLVQPSTEQHEQFEAGLEVFKQYIYATMSEKYGGHKSRNRKRLQEHLHDRILSVLCVVLYGREAADENMGENASCSDS